MGGGPPDGEGHPHHIHPLAIPGRLERHSRGSQATAHPPPPEELGGGRAQRCNGGTIPPGVCSTLYSISLL